MGRRGFGKEGDDGCEYAVLCQFTYFPFLSFQFQAVNGVNRKCRVTKTDLARIIHGRGHREQW